MGGIDLILEGEAASVVDRATLEQLASISGMVYCRGVDGPVHGAVQRAEPRPPPWHMYA